MTNSFEKLFAQIYLSAIRDGKSVVTEVVEAGKQPEAVDFDGKQIEWKKQVSSGREKMVTWIGVVGAKK